MRKHGEGINKCDAAVVGEFNLADLLTKIVSKQLFDKFPRLSERHSGRSIGHRAEIHRGRWAKLTI